MKHCTIGFALLALVVLALGVSTPMALAQVGSPVITVVPFNPAAFEYPEGIAIDKRGNIYVGLIFLGAIRQLPPDGEQFTLATLPPGFLIGLAVDAPGNVYACLVSGDSSTHGVWKISPDGASQRLAALDPSGFPNALAFDHRGNLYVSDSFLGSISRITPDGTTQTWVQNSLLAGDPVNGSGFGANGVAYLKGSLYVANTDGASVIRIPVNPDGSAGTPETYFHDPSILAADGIAFDTHDNLYVICSLFTNRLVMVRPDRSFETLATAADGLDYSASVAFGTGHGQRKYLFIANAGLTFNTPSIQKINVGVPGRPLP